MTQSAPAETAATRRHSINWQIAAPVLLVAAVTAAGFLAPLPYEPDAPGAGSPLSAPSGEHWFGTDVSGFDVFSRTVAAARLDVPLALAGAGFSALIGVPAGLYASHKGRWGEAAMRLLDAFQAFPLVFLAIAVVSLGGNNLAFVVLAIALINIPRFMRIVRTEAVVLRERRFFEAAESMGASKTRLLFVHLLPNVTPVVLVQTSLAAAHAIIVIAALSFLGVGITPPEASWGSMIQSGAQNIATGQWWMSFFPGLAILVVVMSLNWLADSVQQTTSGGH